MNKELLKFFTYFTDIDRIRRCIKDKTRRILLQQTTSDDNLIVAGRLYISEHSAYIVLFPWHVRGFENLIKPYVSCTRLFTCPKADMGGEIMTIYHITGIRNKDYVSDLKRDTE